ncbi:MAG: DegT/DnrJ/EryC1/StrS family aminotransferase [Candidatus Krumholzibacteriia bacterium]
MEPQATGRVGRYDLVTPMIPCKDEIMAKFEAILTTGNFILGQEVRLLEQEVAAACGCADAAGVSSGSSALYAALAVAGVKAGDEVITSPYTFDATMEAIVLIGAVPVFVDIRPSDLNIDPELIEAAITPRTKAIMPVHIFGAPADMDEVEQVAARHGLDVIADMAQAYGTLYRGRPVGACGRMSTLSFYPTKNLPGIGDGGMVVCRDEADAENIRRLRAHVATELGGRLHTGWNMRLDAIQAMAVRVRHARFADEQADRDAAARLYDSFIPAANRLRLDGDGMKCTYHQYWVRCADRDGLRAELDRQGVDTGVYYDPPLHRHALAGYCRTGGELPQAERAGREVLALPIHAALPFDQARRIGAIVRDFLARTENPA